MSRTEQIIDQTSAVGRHIQCIAAGAADPLVYLKRVFAFLSKQESVAASIAWMKFDQDIESIAEAGTSCDAFRADGDLVASLKSHAKALLFRPNNDFSLDATERWMRTGAAAFPLTVNLIIRSNGQRKCVLSFVVKPNDSTIEKGQLIQFAKERWVSYETAINLGLQNCILRVNKMRKSVWEAKRITARRVQGKQEEFTDDGEIGVANPSNIPRTKTLEEASAGAFATLTDPGLTREPTVFGTPVFGNPGASKRSSIEETLGQLQIQLEKEIGPQPLYVGSHNADPEARQPRTAVQAKSVDTLQEQMIRLARGLAPHLEPKNFASAAVNEIKGILGTGRVSMAWSRGGGFQVMAISGCSHLDRRADHVRSLEELVQKSVEKNASFVHPDDREVICEEVALAVEEYYERTQNRSVAIQIITAPKDVLQSNIDPETIFHTEKDHQGEPLAALIIEGIERRITKQEWEIFWLEAEPFMQHGVQNATEVGSLFLLKQRRRFGRFLRWLGEKRLKRVKQSAMVLVAVLLAGSMIPAPMTVVTRGIAQPQSRAKVYSAVNGTIDQILVHESDRFDQGTPLLIIKNTELEIERKKLDGELAETERSVQSIRDQLNSTAPMEESQVLSLRKERAGLLERLNSLELQIALVAEKQSKLKVTSPIPGKSMTWDLAQRLSRLPVEPGQHLLTVADDSKPWELEVLIPETLIGYVRSAEQAKANVDERLEVTFVLASEPGRKYRGTVVSLADTATFDEKEGMVLRAKVTIADQPEAWSQMVKPGTGVIAKIRLGNAPWIYTTTFQLIDSVRRFLFRYL